MTESALVQMAEIGLEFFPYCAIGFHAEPNGIDTYSGQEFATLRASRNRPALVVHAEPRGPTGGPLSAKLYQHHYGA